MKYFLDTEFHEYKRDGVATIELISIGIVRDDGRELYMLSNEFDLAKAFLNDWLRENVLMSIYHENVNLPFTYNELVDLFKSKGKSKNMIRDTILEFIGDDKPEFYGYYADYDWVVFCWLFGRMIDLPKGFPMYCRDLKQMADDYIAKTWDAVKDSTWGHEGLTTEKLKQLPGYPQQTDEHNALADARWNKSLFEFLKTAAAGI